MRVLTDYGDRITDVSLAAYLLKADGLFGTGIDKTTVDGLRARWPHIRWWLMIQAFEQGAFQALADPSSATYRGVVERDLPAILTVTAPWAVGIDIDFEGGYSTSPATALAGFKAIGDKARALGKRVSGAIPSVSAGDYSVGGEQWVRLAQLGAYLDHVSLMTYDFAWVGSAPGPISPASWMEDVYGWAVSQMDPGKLSMGLPAYAYMWGLHDSPDRFPDSWSGGSYRGTAGTYYAVRNMLDGSWVFDSTSSNPAGTVDQPHAGWLAYRDPVTRSPWALTGVYDWWESTERLSSSGYTFGQFELKDYATRYGASSGAVFGQLADNQTTSQQATFMLQPSMIRDNRGEWVEPWHGYNLTIELLQREPQSATILDDDARTNNTLAQLYHADGVWSQWAEEDSDADRPYGQYRTTGGQLTAAFKVGEVHTQARFQLTGPGAAGVTIGAIRAELDHTGVLRLTRGGVVMASTTVSAPGASATPGKNQASVGLRIRGTHARVYHGVTETSMTLRLEADVSPADLDNTTGVWASTGAWFDHARVGDAWWYEPREAVTVQLGDWTWLTGRIPRTGVVWDQAHNRFRPMADVEESATRAQAISLDWGFAHIAGFPATAHRNRELKIIPTDIDCWLGRGYLCDARGALIIHYTDVDYYTHWADTARYQYGLQGIAIWSLGQEDTRVWQRFGPIA
jgi:hypothetical protein